MGLYQDSKYEKCEGKTHYALEYALDLARNRHKVRDKRGNILCSDYELAAVEFSGRKKWTRALCDEIERTLDLHGDDSPALFWFSFADVECTERTYNYPNFDPLKCINKYRRGLRGINYISMLEPAIYASCSRKRPSTFKHFYQFEPLVSWHCHGIAWGDDRRELRRRFNTIQEQGIYTPLIPNLKGCWAKYIRPAVLGDKIAYMCKMPRVTDRVYCQNPDEFDEKRWRFKQKKMRARPGEHVRYFQLLADYTLDQLAFGGGEGSAILQRVKHPFVKRTRA